MKLNSRNTTSGLNSGRMSCAGRAVVALLAIVLLVCAGCDSRVGQTVRQGMYSIYDDAMDSFFTAVGTDVTSEIQNLGGGTDTTGSTTDSTSGGTG